MCKRIPFFIIVLLTFVIGLTWPQSSILNAGGPLRVVRATGNGFIWNTNRPVSFAPDQGPLGSLTNDQATQLTADLFRAWSSIPTTRISFQQSNQLDMDVNGNNVMQFLDKIRQDCPQVRCLNPVIFDSDGSVTDALLGIGKKTTIAGFAGPQSLSVSRILQGMAVINGLFADSLDSLRGIMVHEFGHFAGLDHSQINSDAVFDTDPGNDSSVPTMFPVFTSLYRLSEWATPNPDDIAAISTLYPSSTFASTTGTITGRILYPDGVGFMGANVIARKVDDPKVTAVSSVSGFRHIGTVDPANKQSHLVYFGSDDPNLLGYYEIRGLPPGNYTVEIEAINPTFAAGSRVGPVDPPATLPGPAEFYSGILESDHDDPLSVAAVTVSAGATRENINIILNTEVGRPANDDCTNATVISSFPFRQQMNVYQATTTFSDALSDPLQSCAFLRLNSNSMWYSFTPTSNGTITVDTFGSRYDTVVSIVRGNCQSNPLIEVGCNDDASAGLQSLLKVDVLAGTTYFIEVTNLGGPLGRRQDADLVLNVNFTAATGEESSGESLVAQDKLTAQAVQESEPNNNISSANPITPNETVNGTLDPAGDADFFGFNATQGQQLTIDINAQSINPSSGIDTVVTLFDSSGRQLAENDDGPGSTLDSFLQFTIPTSERYFFRVRDFSARGGRNFTYQVVVTLSGGGGQTVNEVEPNNAITQAQTIIPNVTVAGVLSQIGDADFFAFDATQGQRLTIDVDAQSLTPKSQADAEVTLFDSSGRQIAENNDESAANRDPLLQFTIPTTGRFFFRIRDENNRGGSNFNYQARVTLSGGGQPPGTINESEPNNSIGQADSITPNVTVNGVLNPNGDVDFFAFNATAGQRVKIDIDAQTLTPPSTADTIVELFDSNGTKLAVNDDEASNRLDSLLEFTFTTSGRFFFSVRDFSNKGGSSFTYQATVTLTGGGGGRVNESEPNNIRQQADPITPNVTVVGTLDSANDVDFFGFDAQSGQRVTIDINAQSLTPSSDADTVVTLFDNNGNQLAENDDAGGSLDSLLEFNITTTGRYFIRVRNFSSKGGPTFTYEAVVTLTGGGGPPPPGPGTVNESESNNSIQQANLVRPNVTINGTINPGGDADFFGFDATAGQQLTIDINASSLSPPSALDSVVTLFDSRGAQLAQNDDSGGSVDSFLQFTIPSSGRYFFSVRNFDSKGGPNFNYQAVVTFGGGGGGGNRVDESEPNNTRQQANSITPDATINGSIGFFNDVDFFSFNGRAGQRITIDVNSDSRNPFLQPDPIVTLFNSNGNQIAENDDDPRGGTRDPFLQFTLPSTGQYFFSLRDARNFGSISYDYEIEVSLTRIAGGDAEEFEPNDTFAQANPITQDTTLAGTINPAGDVDIFSFDGAQGQLVIIDVDAESLDPSSPADLKVELFLGGFKLLESDNSLGSRDPFLVFIVAVAGKYSVRVSEATGRGGPNFEYRLTLR